MARTVGVSQEFRIAVQETLEATRQVTIAMVGRTCPASSLATGHGWSFARAWLHPFFRFRLVIIPVAALGASLPVTALVIHKG